MCYSVMAYKEVKKKSKKYKGIQLERFWDKMVEPVFESMIEHTTVVKENCLKKTKKNNETQIRAYNDRLVEQKAEFMIQIYKENFGSESDDNNQQLSNGGEDSVSSDVKVMKSLNLCLNEIMDNKTAILEILEMTNGVDIDYNKEQESFFGELYFIRGNNPAPVIVS